MRTHLPETRVADLLQSCPKRMSLAETLADCVVSPKSGHDLINAWLV